MIHTTERGSKISVSLEVTLHNTGISPLLSTSAWCLFFKRLKSLPIKDTPYIQMIGMIVVFLGIVIGDLVFFRGCRSSKIL